MARSSSMTTSLEEAAPSEDAGPPEGVSGLDPFKVIEELLALGFFDGMIRRLQAQFADLSRAAVEDAVFLAAERCSKLVSPRDNPRAWLYVVARHLLIDERRRKPLETLGPEHEGLTKAPSAEEVALRNSTYRAVVDHVNDWPVAKRRAVVLIVLEAAHLGLPLPDSELAYAAGQALGEAMTVNAAAVHKSRGLALLRQEFPSIFPD